eukprot:gene4805-15103_t
MALISLYVEKRSTVHSTMGKGSESVQVAVRMRPFNNREANSQVCVRMVQHQSGSTTFIKNVETGMAWRKLSLSSLH